MEPLALMLALAATSTSAEPPVSGNEETGFLLVLSDIPDAVVRVDGARAGLTPLPMLEVPAGEHLVTVEIAGYGRYTTTVTVAPGEIVRVDAVVSPRSILRPSPAERLGIRTDQTGDAGPMITRPWFWGVAGAIAASVLVVGLVLASGGDFVPEGELGNSSTSEWTRF